MDSFWESNYCVCGRVRTECQKLLMKKIPHTKVNYSEYFSDGTPVAIYEEVMAQCLTQKSD